ncbi:hypothetical protein J3R82DRAFT_3598 [Butyriboletus roseoflavus]|nr:hypothetical protein J3R82DRAFT_3598 [Butyriboletus roseoflavus]
MANFLRTAKSGTIFFGVNPLPHSAVAAELLDNVAANHMVDEANYKLHYMDLATHPVPSEESAADDFAVHLFTLLGYVPRARMEDKQHMEPKDPEPQLIADAIAAFQTNNYRRTRILGQDPIAHKVMPGITLKGTSPIFYKIPITAQLAQSVALDMYPATPTVVHARLPALARPARRLSEGMKPLDNRATILACYEAFKRFMQYLRFKQVDGVGVVSEAEKWQSIISEILTFLSLLYVHGRYISFPSSHHP